MNYSSCFWLNSYLPHRRWSPAIAPNVIFFSNGSVSVCPQLYIASNTSSFSWHWFCFNRFASDWYIEYSVCVKGENSLSPWNAVFTRILKIFLSEYGGYVFSIGLISLLSSSILRVLLSSLIELFSMIVHSAPSYILLSLLEIISILLYTILFSLFILYDYRIFRLNSFLATTEATMSLSNRLSPKYLRLNL